MSAEPESSPVFAQRRIGTVNWLGLWTMYAKEVRRFWKVVTQTVVAPAVTTMLFLAVFTLALGGAGRGVEGVPFELFLAPGLIIMTVLQNAFANTSSSILIAKVQGNIVDVLMPPLSPGELTFAYAMGGVTRGVVVGLAVAGLMLIFIDLSVTSWLAVIFYGVNASLMLSLLGILTGVWAEKFDHAAAVTNFIVVPLSFLSGTFYSIDRLPGIWHIMSQYNPFFYLIDGFRYAFIGRADGSLVVGAIAVFLINTTLWTACYLLFRRGYKLRP